ncbi:MAG: hypothetical protein R2853_05595 [Thermomicrobiales bacterium]
MDTTTFDTLARTVSASTTRRSALRGLVAGAATLAAGGMLLQGEDGLARRRKGKKGKKGKGKNQKLQPGERCQSDSQCTSGYICEVPVNGSNSDEYCSGGQGATCGAPNGDGDDTFPFCAVGFDCTPTGNGYTCQAVPDEV